MLVLLLPASALLKKALISNCINSGLSFVYKLDQCFKIFKLISAYIGQNLGAMGCSLVCLCDNQALQKPQLTEQS